MVSDFPAIQELGRSVNSRQTLNRAIQSLVKPSGVHRSEPTPLWTKKRPSGSYFFLISARRAVGAPVGMPKVRLEEIAFRDVGSAAGSNGAEFVHTSMHGVGGFAALGNVGLVIGDSGIRRPLAVRNDGKS